jgi:exodeoxyribonuclease I
MAREFYFYDLETSGISPRESRIMQFAGQRTNLDLQPIGQPFECFIKLTPDILPDPQAILLTGITPQQTQDSGLTEAEFLDIFSRDISLPGTIFVGFNSVRFDDEFMRYAHYRNFYDPYEWQWKDDRSRWDLLDLVRMTRALRPEGISWPYDEKGIATNRLELLTVENGLTHSKAHDALSDVLACIELAKLIKTTQPKLFKYLLLLRGKKNVAKLVMSRKPFLYTSGKYPSEFDKTTIVTFLADHPDRQGALVYDLRFDPTELFSLSPEQLASSWSATKDTPHQHIPVKTLKFNRCPAIAPLSVLDSSSEARLKIDRTIIEAHNKILLTGAKDWIPKVFQALEILDEQRHGQVFFDPTDAEGLLYEGFFNSQDKKVMEKLRNSKPLDMNVVAENFSDERLRKLVPIYKAHNYPSSLTSEEHEQYERYIKTRLLSGGDKSRYARFEITLQSIAEQSDLSSHQRYVLEELDLWAQSILPFDDAMLDTDS